MSQFNLSQAVFDKVEALGQAEACKLFHTTATNLRKWQAGTSEPTATACQIVLDEAMERGEVEVDAFETPPTQGQTIPEKAAVAPEARATTEGEEVIGNVIAKPPVDMLALAEKSHKPSFLIPINRDMSYAVVMSILGNWKSTLPEEIRPHLANLDFEPDTMIHRSRNILATRFIASGNEWSFWFDSDIIAPIGNAAWFKRRTGTKLPDKWFQRSAFEALTTKGKTLISAVYAERNLGGKIIAQPGLSPMNDQDKSKMAELHTEGPRNEVIQVGWVGFGCVAVHRKVFLDILETQPEVRAAKEGDPHGFFTSMEDGPQGEDVALCARALKAGHPSFLDLSVFCAHIGKFPHLP